MLCCIEYTSAVYETCMLVLTRASGDEETVNLFGAAVDDIYDQAGDVVGFKITNWGGDQITYVGSASVISKSTVMAHINNCHTLFLA